MNKAVQGCAQMYSFQQSGNRELHFWTSKDHFIDPFVMGARPTLSCLVAQQDGNLTNVCTLTQFYRKWHRDFSLTLMDRILKHVAISSVPSLSVGIREGNLFPSEFFFSFFFLLNISAYISGQRGALSITSGAAGKHAALDVRSGNQRYWPDDKRNRVLIGSASSITTHVSSVLSSDLLGGNYKHFNCAVALITKSVHPLCPNVQLQYFYLQMKYKLWHFLFYPINVNTFTGLTKFTP